MDFGRLEAQSNRATFQREFQIVDDDTDELLDLTDKAIVFEIKHPTDCRALLSATIDNGKIVVVDLGIFIVTFARSEMTNLCPGTYDLGITIGDNEETGQALIGTLAIAAGGGGAMSMPVLKLRQSVQFPAQVYGANGIDVTKAHGNYTIQMDWADFATTSVIPTSPTNNVLTFDTATSTYVMVPSSLLGGSTAGIADVVPAGNYYRTPGAWVSGDFLQAGSGAQLRSMQDKGRDWVSIKDFGAVGNGSHDDTQAFDLALAYMISVGVGRGGCIHFPPGKYRFNSSVGLTFPNSPFQLSIVGSGEENTVLYFPSGDGLKCIFSHNKNGFRIMDLSITTGGNPGGIGLNLQHTVHSGSECPPTEIVRVTLRGDDGALNFNSWTSVIITHGISNVTLDMVSIQGNAAAAGTGYTCSGLGGSGSEYSVIINIQGSAFNNVGTGFIYGDFMQGVTINQTNFNGCATSIATPPSCVGTLSQLSITNCEFGLFSNGVLGIITQSPVIGVQICNNLFILAPDNSTAIWLENNAYFNIIGNLISAFSVGTNNNGILIGNGGGKSVVTGNVIWNFARAIILDASSHTNAVVMNAIHNCTFGVLDSGTSNTTTPNY